MERSMTLAAAAAVLGAAGLVVALLPRGACEDARPPIADDTDRAVEEATKPLRAEVEGLRQEVRTLREEGRSLRADLGTLSARVEAGGAKPAAPQDGTGDAAAPKPAATAEGNASQEDFQALRKKVFAGTASLDEQQRFWELARTSGALGDELKTLEAAVAADPTDATARMNLAQAYVSKLLTVPDGPERGTWAMKAEGQWAKVLERDDRNWEARYSLAFSWSRWPDFLNKAPDAIREFESLRRQQELGSPEERHAQTYLQLAGLYRRQGNVEKARETLAAGLARHRDDAELKKALDALPK